MKKNVGHEIRVRMDDGSHRTLHAAQPDVGIGQRVNADAFPAWRVAACLLPAVLLAACGTTTQQQQQKPRFNLSGYSATFKQGHADGCASAGGRQRRDERLFRDNADYMMGWNDGRSACK